MNKKILIVCNSFYPEQNPRSFRATELVREFRRQKHSVTLMCPETGSLREFSEEWSIEHHDLGVLNWKIKNFKGENIVVKTYNRIVNRLLPKLFEYPSIELFFKVRKALKNNKNQYDALISIAVPYTIHWGVASVWKAEKNKNPAAYWIADCGDPYFIQQNDKLKTPFYFGWVEKWFMRKVDYVTVPTKEALKGYFSEFHPKLRVIPQGFKFEDVQVKTSLKDGIVRFGYAGGFTVWRRDPTRILEYLSNLDSGFRFEFHIYTRDVAFVDHFSQKDSRIILHGFKPRLELLEELSQYDFMLNLENFGDAQSPSKLIDYGIINKPILSLKSFDLKIELLEEFLRKDYSNSLIIENVSDFRIENVVNSFLALLD